MSIKELAPLPNSEAAYFNRLAERQLDLAQRSANAAAVAAHCALADHYLELRALAERSALAA